jgi:1-acyl-sn-glycerol-3-phosphate acyltransferase
LRALYLPWAWLVFMPALAVLTVALGLVQLGLSFVSPRVAFHVSTVWAWLLCRLNWTIVSVRGRENVVPGRGYVVLANHQSHFDVLAFISSWHRQHRWVIKKELRRIPVFGAATEAYGCVYVDRGNPEKAMASLRSAAPQLGRGISFAVFPEGTRSPDGRLLPFKKGGFLLAVENGAPILPVTISGSRDVLPNRSLRPMPGRIVVTVHPPVETAGLGRDDVPALVEQVRATIASALPGGGR